MQNEFAVSKSIHRSVLTRSNQILTGLITGIVADGQLHDLEIQMLNTWLSENSQVTDTWPGSAIAQLVRNVLADGRISPEKREYLLRELQALVGSDFSDSGSTTPTVAALPFDRNAQLIISGARICHTGEFMFGTRSACEKLTEEAGGTALETVTRKTTYLVVGTHVSPSWTNTSYGRKIAQAMALKSSGHPILIASEQQWLEACSQ